MKAVTTMGTTDFEAIGYAAYSTSTTAAPGANADVQEAIKGMPVGTGATAIFEAFNRGWNKAADEAAAAVLAEPEGEAQRGFRAIQGAMDEYHGRHWPDRR